MLRNEIQEKTGLTRKAIEYYEEKGFINPSRKDNGYRDYSEDDLSILKKISFYKKLDLNLPEIEECLSSSSIISSSILRKKEQELELNKRKISLMKSLLEDKIDINKILDELNIIEKEETLYSKLEKAFPGYFGQMFFSSYKEFLNEPVNKGNEDAFIKYIEFVDRLPTFELSEEEKEYIEKISSHFTKKTLDQINKEKIQNIEHYENFITENKVHLENYLEFKNSDVYLNSPMKSIQDKLQQYMVDNKYYEFAIPLIRKFSQSYNDYYIKLLEANEYYLNSLD